MLAHGEYAALEQLSGGARVGAADLEHAVREYGRTLSVPPPGSEPALVVVEIRNARPRAWFVDVPLWSREEGRSDLTLQLRLVAAPAGGYRVELEDLHVL